jgi:hypothetical protein
MRRLQAGSRLGGPDCPGSWHWAGALALGLGLILFAGEVSAQTSLADYDYENLSFRGFSFEGGYIWPTRAEPTYTIGTRVDLGYLGPGLRLIPGVAYWSSTMKDSEVRKLERNVDDLVEGQLDPGTSYDGVDLGTIDWSDFILSMDGHFVWSVPLDLLTFAGGGMSLHIMDGDGEAISGTFVEDLLDSVRPGFNVHGGLEYPMYDRFRLYGVARYELMEDLRYFELRFGGQIMLTGPASGEERSP